MSKKQYRSSASAARAFGGQSSTFGFGGTTGFAASTSALSYLTELPDLSSISDANTVVAFKNLTKRDATTKTKALEDLYSFLSGEAFELEDGLLDAWTSVYPRTSIDAARRVRQLAHSIQGCITAKSGRRIAKRLPAVIGAWLAGQYDSDKAVSRAASDALAQAFPTAEKRFALWKAYHSQIFDFSQNILDHESPRTLSDERSISSDEANTKYFRVVSSAIGLLSTSVSTSSDDDVQKNGSRYREVFQDRKLWEKATMDDVGVRRAVHKLLRSLLQSDSTRACLDFSLLSKVFVSKGLDSDQSGSASEFLVTLVALTQVEKNLWTDLWQDKKPPTTRLRSFFKRGSQASALAFWSSIRYLFEAVPKSALPSTGESAEELLSSIRIGVTRKDEPRSYVAVSLKAYVDTAAILAENVPESERSNLLKSTVFTLLLHFMYPKAEDSKWNISANAAYAIVPEIAKNKTIAMAVATDFEGHTMELQRQIKQALPEQASGYTKSQEELGQVGQRFAILVSTLTKLQGDLALAKSLQDTVAEIIRLSLTTLVDRAGKPYGVAIVVAEVIKQCKEIIDRTEATTSTIETFLNSAISKIFASPSYKQLAAILQQYENQGDLFLPAWNKCFDAVLADSSSLREPALVELLTCRTIISEADMQSLGPAIEPVLLPKIEALWATNDEWEPLIGIFRKSAMVSKLFGRALLHRTNAALLSMQANDVMKSVEGLRKIAEAVPGIVRAYVSTEDGKSLLPNLLLSSESSDEGIAHAATGLIPIVQGLLGAQTSSDSSGGAIIDVIKNGLNTAGPNSVSVETLANHAKNLLDNKLVASAETLLPSAERWSASLASFADLAVDKSRSLTSELGGSVYLISSSTASNMDPVERDADGFSVPLRMMAFTIKLVQITPAVGQYLHPRLLDLLAWTILLANDDVSIYNPQTSLWTGQDPTVVTEISDLVALGLNIIQSHFVEDAETFEFEPLDRSPHSYYKALLRAKIHGAIVRPQPNVERLEARLKDSIAHGDIFSAISQLYAFQDDLSSSALVAKQCNILISDLTELADSKLQDDGMPKFALLNAILSNYEDSRDTIAKPRLSRFVSKIVAWLSDETVEDECISEIYQALAQLLPEMSDMYGEYWKTILKSIKETLELVSELPDANAPALIPLVYTAIQLFGEIRRIKLSEESKPDDEKNEDVLEAWVDLENGITAAMINTLQIPRLVSDEQHTPLMILNLRLSREVARIPTSKLNGVEALYGQLYSPSLVTQQAAYRILHRYIPSRQEQISLDTALDRTSAHLPDELLSLILEVPAATAFPDEDFERSVPLQLRGYLLSWLLVFDHFTNATHKLRSDYVSSMKESGNFADLLEFTFEFLGHSKMKPIDVSKFDIGSYNTSTFEDQPLKDTQWLLSHLYYLSLTHFPGLAKAWWFECKSRGKSIAVEAWTGKYISPLVMSTALETALTWSTTQEQAHTSEEPPPLVIRINHRTQELTASYPMDVDEGQNAVITVSLPESFPLHNAKVTSPTKAMAVDERKWLTWLRNSQAIIASPNNNIVDGLLAWRRNVFGALKGQTECAICYSVVGEDGKVPTRKCKTCKNSFHSGCLFKWFKSSNGSTCPLCRQPYSYA